MTQHRIGLDEGGVRHTLMDGDVPSWRYFPYAELADIELRTRLLRDPVLVFVDVDAEEHVVFAGPDALEIHKALVEHAVGGRRRAAEHWPREGRALDAWLASLDPGGAGADGGYRTSGDAGARALSVLEDAFANIEDRAAAAYLLVRSAEGEDLIATAKVFASRSLPPLVLAAARMAPGGDSLTHDDALVFLPRPDQEAFVPGGTKDEHAAASAEAKRILSTEAHHALTAAPEKRASAHHPPAAYRDMSKWIGKSWGI